MRTICSNKNINFVLSFLLSNSKESNKKKLIYFYTVFSTPVSFFWFCLNFHAGCMHKLLKKINLCNWKLHFSLFLLCLIVTLFYLRLWFLENCVKKISFEFVWCSSQVDFLFHFICCACVMLVSFKSSWIFLYLILRFLFLETLEEILMNLTFFAFIIFLDVLKSIWTGPFWATLIFRHLDENSFILNFESDLHLQFKANEKSSFIKIIHKFQEL